MGDEIFLRPFARRTISSAAFSRRNAHHDTAGRLQLSIAGVRPQQMQQQRRCDAPAQRDACGGQARRPTLVVRAVTEAPAAEAQPEAAAPSLTSCPLENLLNTQVCIADGTCSTRRCALLMVPAEAASCQLSLHPLKRPAARSQQAVQPKKLSLAKHPYL